METLDADVAVVGVGTMGAMTAWQLAERGLSVLGFEQFAPGHDRSAAGGESRLFRTIYHESPQYGPLLQRAQTLWRRLEVITDRSLLTLNGGLTIGEQDSELIGRMRASAAAQGVDHEVLSAAQLRDRFSQHRVTRGDVAVLDRESGMLRPEFAVLSAAEAATASGARVLTGARVTRVEPDGDRVLVTAGDRTYRVGHAVITTGPWARRLAPVFGELVTARRIVMTWFMARDRAQFSPDRFPIFIREVGGYRFFGTPTLDGGSVKVAQVADFGPVVDPDELALRVEPAELDAIVQAVDRHLPGLVPSPVRISAYMDGFTQDGHPVVGALPGVDRVWVAAGFSGHGFKLSPAIGQLLADLVTTGTTCLPTQFLDPSRLTSDPVPAGPDTTPFFPSARQEKQ